MPDIIHLLPDSVANQIAAGEVIQRPASAVKELLENAVDAGSTRIEVYTKDSGKSMIRVIDNGSGMSTTDTRLCIARHATSKIRAAEDLFMIRTMGFRGEALASIAAISQLEVKTRRKEDEIGTELLIENSEVKSQQQVSTPIGTSIIIKNLFYNVPARRNFLKSNTVEARHIIDEFERVALSHPEVSFLLNQNGLEIFQLPVANLRQRIVNVYGSHYNERLVPVSEDTSLLSISGFIGKPEFAKKTRGEQFFFVNRRFIKDHYLNHAVTNAFEELLPRDSYASYWLLIDIQPGKIDVNIHPTKTEIKFEDERSVYAIVRAAVKRALGQYSVTPTLDFEHEKSFDLPHSMRSQPAVPPGITINPGYNPFQRNQDKIRSAGWEKLYDGVSTFPSSIQTEPVDTTPPTLELSTPGEIHANDIIFQLNSQSIVLKIDEGLLIVDQQAAHERVLYEKFVRQLANHNTVTQQELFPQTINFSAADYQLVKELETEIRALGFDIRDFGTNTFVLHGSPIGVEKGLEKDILDSLLEHYKNNQTIFSGKVHENLARSMARSMSIKKGKILERKEMTTLLNDLNQCEKPGSGIDGKVCMVIWRTEELMSRFK